MQTIELTITSMDLWRQRLEALIQQAPGNSAEIEWHLRNAAVTLEMARRDRRIAQFTNHPMRRASDRRHCA